MTNHPNRGRAIAASNPDPKDIIELRLACKLTQTAAAALVHTTSRVWLQWETEKGKPSHRRMHPAFWELLQIRAAATL